MSSPPQERLDPVTQALALAGIVLGIWLYVGGLDRALIQHGNEAMYAAPAATMLASGDYLVPRWEYHPFLDKPPLTFWILAAGYRALGVSVFSAKLPGALSGLATAVLLGAWVGRRSGVRSGVLAALILAFSFQFSVVALTFAADTFLTLALLLAVAALDAACRREEGSDVARGALAGLALATAFYCKGLVGIALPAGAVAAGLLFDRKSPVRPLRRGAWAFAVLVLLAAPWHVAMTLRLGPQFWRTFYWENQFLRGATARFMQASRGPVYYLGVLAWAIFPWSLLLPGLLRRGKASSVFLGWLTFGFVFWSLLVMKREVYLMTILPAAAAVAAEGLTRPGEARLRWRRIAWIAATVAPAGALVFWAKAFEHLAELARSRGAVLFLGAALLLLGAAAGLAASRPKDSRAPFAVALACGVLLLALQGYEARLVRFDPLPGWGARIRAECARGCDGFLFANNFNSIDFYSGFDWTFVADPARELPERLAHPTAFVVTWTSHEPDFAGLALKWEVLDRRPAFRHGPMSAALGVPGQGVDSLSLIRIERVGAAGSADQSGGGTATAVPPPSVRQPMAPRTMAPPRTE